MKWTRAVSAVLALVMIIAAPVWSADDEDDDTPVSPYTYGGSADAYYSKNFNNPFTGMNTLRAFDVRDSRIDLGLIDIWLERARTPIGFRVDLQFGPTSNLVQAFDPNKSDVMDRIQQLYVSANTNKEGTHYFEFGKWVTMHGAELIEPVDNWLYTRGLLFTWAIPFYHTGARYWNYFNDHDYVMVNITQGWNTSFQDNGDGDASFGISFGKKAGPVTYILNYQGGNEPGATGTDFGFRHLLDAVVTYDPSPLWNFVFNADYGTQDGVNLGPGPMSTRVSWYGVSGMTKYQIDGQQYVAFRAEVLRDKEGFLFGTPQTAASVSLGYTRHINKYFQVRGEVRHDWSTFGSLFPSGVPGAFQGGETTVGIATILSYQ